MTRILGILSSCFASPTSHNKNSITPIVPSLSTEQPENDMDTKHPPKGGSVLQSMYHSVRKLWYASAAYKEDMQEPFLKNNRLMGLSALAIIGGSTGIGAGFGGVGAVPGFGIGCLMVGALVLVPTVLSNLYFTGGLIYRPIKAALSAADDLYANSEYCKNNALGKIENTQSNKDLPAVMSTISTKTFQTDTVRAKWKEKCKNIQDQNLLSSWIQKDPAPALEHLFSLGNTSPKDTIIKNAISGMSTRQLISFLRACDKPEYLTNLDCYAVIQERVHKDDIDYWELIEKAPDVHAILYKLQPSEDTTSSKKLPSTISAFITFAEEKGADPNTVLQVKARLPYLANAFPLNVGDQDYRKQRWKECKEECREKYILPLWNSLTPGQKSVWLQDPICQKVRQDLGDMFPLDAAIYDIESATTVDALKDVLEKTPKEAFIQGIVYSALGTDKKKTLLESDKSIGSILIRKDPITALQYLESHFELTVNSFDINTLIPTLDKDQLIAFMRTYGTMKSLQDTCKEWNPILLEAFNKLSGEKKLDIMQNAPDIYLIFYKLGMVISNPVFVVPALIAYAKEKGVPAKVISQTVKQFNEAHSISDKENRARHILYSTGPITDWISKKHFSLHDDLVYKNIIKYLK